MTFAEQLGLLLKKDREPAGLKQKDIADNVGYETAQFISNFERGLALPPAEVLCAMGEMYKLTPDAFESRRKIWMESKWQRALPKPEVEYAGFGGDEVDEANLEMELLEEVI